MHRPLALLVVVVAVGCGPAGSIDGGSGDAGLLPDAGGGDAGPGDAGGRDAGTDGGTATDAGVDAGPPPDCQVDNGGCSALATCTPAPGGRTCACKPGYGGDGLTCADIDECATPGVACALSQTCTNTVGSFTCTCTTVELDLDTPFADGGTVPFPSSPGLFARTPLWGSNQAPLPTNTSWVNFVVGAGSSRVDFLPYQLKAEPVFLDVATDAPTANAQVAFVPEQRQLMLGALEFGGATTRVVTKWDLLSVTLQWTQGAGTMTAPLVWGMPYVTADYAGLRPLVLPGNFTFTQVNGATAPGTVSGTRFSLQLSDGSSWLLYTSSAVTFAWTPGNLAAQASFTGTLRVANAPTPAAATVLDAHAQAVPRGGAVTAQVTCDAANVRFSWQTSGTGPLLMAAMPHHLPRLSLTAAGPTWSSLGGTLTAVEGSTWDLRYPLTPVGFSAPRAPVPTHLAEVRAALIADASFIPDPGTVSNDSYFGGKQLAKLARLALIADELGETAIATTLRARLTPPVAAWLTGTNGNPFRYDTTWGGLVTLQSLASAGASFGSGHYNDHHFHYGYLLYAAAALAKASPAFAATHRAALLAIVRDIANPSLADPRFPRFRHLDFFRAHSWAGGLQDNPDGQDQESSSEAVNAWYAVHLLGLSTGDRRLSDLGRVMLALELDAARTYYQVPAASTIYPPVFAQNGCVGRLYQTRVTFDTFFGTEPWKVFGIQMLPFTPITEELISPTWVSDRWPAMQSAAASVPPGWIGFRGFLYMAHATSARELAWTEATGLTGWDDGNSKANTLWWIATRP